MRSRPILCVALAVGLSVGAAQGEELGDILGKLGPGAPPKGSVDVTAWVEHSGDQSELVVNLAPAGEAKLVAEPGITVHPEDRKGLDWKVAEPVTVVDPKGGYFDGAQTVRVPFKADDGAPIPATVEYAYCLVDYQCLFGETKLNVPQG